MFETQKNSMAAYYAQTTLQDGHLADRQVDAEFGRVRQGIHDAMDAFVLAHPDVPAVLLKSHLHTLMAQACEPVVFQENPFFFEIGFREANSWGLSSICPAGWVRAHMEKKLHQAHPILGSLEAFADRIYDLEGLGLCQAQNTFDGDHHTLGYTALFAVGVNGLIAQAVEKQQHFPAGSAEAAFCQAAAESCQALITIAQKFAARAEEMLPSCTTEKESRYLTMMAQAAGVIPAQPPRTFYQGLAMLLFTREVTATLEGLGISQLGHVDKLLAPLYDADLAAGRITEAEARELIGIWMLHTDIKFDLAHASWPETSTCIQLGGCDVSGNPVYHPVSRMFMEEHHRLKLVNPKLNCRYDAAAPDEYLMTAGRAILAGHNNFVMINDDIILSGLMRSGVEACDARRYVSGGCQETMIEGLGHTEGVAFYASMPRVLDLFLRPALQSEDLIPPINAPKTFEDFLAQYLHALDHFFALVIDQRNIRQHYMKEALVCPLFSATQEGCIASGRDYTSGGAKYNFSTISLIGLGTVVDSLLAVKTLIYDQQRLTLEQLNAVLAGNWAGHEALRQEVIAMPKYGHDHAQADALADMFLTRLAALICVRKNERGGHYLPSLFVYYHFESFARMLRATPDGRRDFDLISAGVAPGQLRAIRDVTTPVRSMQRVDFTACGGGSCVLDVKLPLSGNMTPALFAAFIRACRQYGCPTLQPNVISQEELLDAKRNPDKHRELIVRICGLSAYFVALTPQVQDEIIARNMYAI